MIDLQKKLINSYENGGKTPGQAQSQQNASQTGSHIEIPNQVTLPLVKYDLSTA